MGQIVYFAIYQRDTHTQNLGPYSTLELAKAECQADASEPINWSEAARHLWIGSTEGKTLEDMSLFDGIYTIQKWEVDAGI